MSTKFNKVPVDTFGENALYGASIPEDYEIPPCGIEDVDRALFNLFNVELPLFYEMNGEQHRVPCIFATGERAFILRRKKPLTDRHGALILPMVSILRTNLEQSPDEGYGIGPGTGQLKLRQRIHSDTTELANEINRLGLQNQGNVVTENQHIGPSIRGYQRSLPVGTGFLDLEPATKVVETITMPSVRFFKSTYEVTFWGQYLQQMNEMLEGMMVSYSWNPARAFRIETDKGYWFVAQVESDVGSEMNFDEFTEEERVIKYMLTIGVNGYIINPKYHGDQNMLRRTVSAPKVSFDSGIGIDMTPAKVPVASDNVADYLYENFEEANSPLPGSGIGKSVTAPTNPHQDHGLPGIAAESAGAGAMSRSHASEIGGHAARDSARESATFHGKGTSVGGHRKLGDTEVLRVENFKDPFTGNVEKKIVKIKTSSTKFGEKVVNPLTI